MFGVPQGCILERNNVSGTHGQRLRRFEGVEGRIAVKSAEILPCVPID